MKGPITRALLVTLVLSNAQSFSMVESIKQHAGSFAHGARNLAQKAIESSKAQPYVAAGVGVGLLGALGLSTYAYSKYQARKTEAHNRAAALQLQREESATVVDAIVASVANAKSNNNSAIFTGKNYQANAKMLRTLCAQYNMQKQYDDFAENIVVYVTALDEVTKALQKKVQNSDNIVAQADAQYVTVVKQLKTLKVAIVNPPAQQSSRLARVAQWTGVATVAAGAAYGAMKLWNWYRG